VEVHERRARSDRAHRARGGRAPHRGPRRHGWSRV